ncbi:unnamed protein product [marine sediment metagenome]|uniref:Uncharacterized protein n=1 Tax=marine sediment metagenome TaxID=412755 RepID=X1EAM7_9ZZZZ
MFNKLLYQTRFLEILPGALSWTVLIIPIVIAALQPYWVACFVIVFDFYWLVRAVIFGTHLVSGYLKIKRDSKIDWLSRLKELKKDPQKYLEKLNSQLKNIGGLGKRILEREIRQVKRAIRLGFLDWEKYIKW